MAKIENKDIIEAIKEKTILEVKELVDMMKEEFGVDPSAVAVAAQPAASAEDEGDVTKTVVLANAGGQKLQVIKLVREITGLGLVDAKGLVDKVPSEIKKDVPAEEGAKLKETLEAAGAVVELK